MQPLLNEYQFLGELGHDAFGAVYRAQNIKTQRLVTIKCIESGMTDITALKWRFDRMLGELKQLKHRNVVPLMDYFVEADKYFLIQEFWHGETLNEWLQEMGRMSVKLSVQVLVKILDAFEVAHQQGLIYGHLTPNSIIMAGFREVKILNFGLLTFLDEHGLLNVENLKGTISCAAPEQLMRPARSDQLTDIYRLGMLFYQMLTAKLPLAHESDRYLVRKTIASGHLPLLLKFPPKVPDPLKQIIYKAINPQPRKRYQSVVEMKKSLLAAHKKTKHVIPGTTAEEPRSHPQGMKLKAGMFLLNAVLVALIIFLWIMKSPRNIGSKETKSSTPDRQLRVPSSIVQSEISNTKVVPIDINKPQNLNQNDSTPHENNSVKRSISSSYSKKPVRPEKAPPSKTAFSIGTGSIHVSSNPGAARVEILQNNRSIRSGRTPCRITNLPFGPLAVRIIHAGGYQVFEQDVNLRAGAPVFINAELVPLPIAVKINSQPAGAQIILDGERIDGETPLTVNMNEFGEHRILYIKEGFKPVEETFCLSPDRPSVSLSKQLLSEPVDFTIRLLYPGRIYLNGVPQNYDWQEKIQLTNIYPGKYSLMVLYKNKQSQIKEFYITPADSGRMIDIYP